MQHALERRLAQVPDETLGWEAVGARLEVVAALQPGGLAVWSGALAVPPEAAGERRRLVVREFEPFAAFTPVGPEHARPAAGRPVYVDIVEL